MTDYLMPLLDEGETLEDWLTPKWEGGREWAPTYPDDDDWSPTNRWKFRKDITLASRRNRRAIPGQADLQIHVYISGTRQGPRRALRPMYWSGHIEFGRVRSRSDLAPVEVRRAKAKSCREILRKVDALPIVQELIEEVLREAYGKPGAEMIFRRETKPSDWPEWKRDFDVNEGTWEPFLTHFGHSYRDTLSFPRGDYLILRWENGRKNEKCLSVWAVQRGWSGSVSFGSRLPEGIVPWIPKEEAYRESESSTASVSV